MKSDIKSLHTATLTGRTLLKSSQSITLLEIEEFVTLLMADNIELSEAEKKQCRNMFESFDKYGYGQISIPDFLKVS